MLLMGTSRPREITLKDVLFMPVGCLISLSPAVIFAVLVISALVGSFFYNFVNVDFFGLGAPPFDDMVFDPSFTRLDQSDGTYLTITYEKQFNSTFTGLVRHITPIRLGDFPILTHDVLITSDEFSDPNKVHTAVIDHHFSWTSAERSPQGTINLLHTVPVSEPVYQELLELRSGQNVRVIGREILKIDSFSSDGRSKGWWQDSGCNTLVITSIELLP
jgi:hypothetical protein